MRVTSATLLPPYFWTTIGMTRRMIARRGSGCRVPGTSIRQREHEHRPLPGADDVLLAVHRVADGPARVRTAEIDVPQQLAGLRVERDEVAFHAAAEDEITGGREHARLGVVDHLEIPLLLAGLRVEGADRTVPL